MSPNITNDLMAHSDNFQMSSIFKKNTYVKALGYISCTYNISKTHSSVWTHTPPRIGAAYECHLVFLERSARQKCNPFVWQIHPSRYLSEVDLHIHNSITERNGKNNNY